LSVLVQHQLDRLRDLKNGGFLDHRRDYGRIFTIWDRVFQTFCTETPKHLGLIEIVAVSIAQMIIAGFCNLKASLLP
jgi:hypothetical protein